MRRALKTPVGKWIKNVYNLGIHHVKTSGQTSTEAHEVTDTTKDPAHIHQLIPNLFTQFHRSFTQQNNPLSSPLNNQLYTVSTGPIITKTKEKRERN